MTNKELLQRAAEIKLQIKALEEEYKDNELQIITAIFELNPEDRKVDVGELGRFSVSMTKVWEYSDEVVDKTAELKKLKDDEQATGLATYKEVPGLRFMARKSDD